MDNLTIDTFVAALARHFLTTAAGVVIANGYSPSGVTQEQIVGAGMLGLGVVLSWWNKRGYALVIGRLKTPHVPLPFHSGADVPK